MPIQGQSFRTGRVSNVSGLWEEEEAFDTSDPEVFLQENLGDHSAPNSPLVSVALNILHSDLWIRVAELLRQLCRLMQGGAQIP